MKRGEAADDYRAWKAGVTAEMERLHGIAASIVPEHVWTRFYVRGMSPEEAAKGPRTAELLHQRAGRTIGTAKRSPEQS